MCRSDSHALHSFRRPETSFLWITNPLKTFQFIIWDNWKYKILMFLVIVLLVIFFGLFLYNLPQASMDKIFTLF